MYIKQANKQQPFQCTWVIFFLGLLFVSGMVQYLKMDSYYGSDLDDNIVVIRYISFYSAILYETA